MKYAGIFVHTMKHCYVYATALLKLKRYVYSLHMRAEDLCTREITSVYSMRKECRNRVKNGRLPSARKYGNAIAIFETKPLYEKRQIHSGATTILSRLV